MKTQVSMISALAMLLAGCATGTVPATSYRFAGPSRRLPADMPIIDAKAKRMVTPSFPDGSASTGMKGEVTVSFVVKPSGRLSNIKVVQSQLGGPFDAQAMDAMTYWQFDSAQIGCYPVAEAGEETFTFDGTGPVPKMTVKPAVMTHKIASPLPEVPAEEVEYLEQYALSARFHRLQKGETDDSVKPLKQVPPRWPRRALQKGISGVVVMHFDIDTAGEPKDVRVVYSDPAGLFDEGSVAAIRRWRFAPEMVNGKAAIYKNACQTIEYRIGR